MEARVVSEIGKVRKNTNRAPSCREDLAAFREEAPPDSSFSYDLSIITVCRNARQALLQTVIDVLEKKKASNIRIEHIIVDGASSDGTADMLARLLGEGKVEAYLSKPDNGIYDAMNKGIHLARGKCLFFLNTGDELEKELDFAQFVKPIVDGECDCTCGCWRLSSDLETRIEPSFFTYFCRTPCNHQAYFLSKAWYNKLGGYNDKYFRCFADGDVMWRVIADGGLMREIKHSVVIYEVGGFSEINDTRFLNEKIYICYQHIDRVVRHARECADYAAFLMQNLTMCVHEFPAYMHSGGKDVRNTVLRMQALCRAICSARRFRFGNLMFKIICGSALRAFAAGKTGCLRRFMFWRLPALFLPWPEDKRYSRYCAPLSFVATLSHRLKKARE